MKFLKPLLCCLFFVSIVNFSYGQCTNYSFLTQQNVDDFVANNSASCSTILTLEIRGSSLDLSGLTFLTEIACPN